MGGFVECLPELVELFGKKPDYVRSFLKKKFNQSQIDKVAKKKK